MRWKLLGLAAGTALLIFLVVSPVFTVHVTIQLPSGTTPPPVDKVQAVGAGVVIALSLAVTALICAAAGWIATRIVRHDRKKKRPSADADR